MLCVWVNEEKKGIHSVVVLHGARASLPSSPLESLARSGLSISILLSRTRNRTRSMSDPVWQQEKKAGNDSFGAGRVKEAVEHYTKALKEDGVPNGDRATILSNRAQCHLKLGDNAAAVDDCTACLTLAPGNVKALFRR